MIGSDAAFSRRPRKEAYLRHLAGADASVLLVSAADRLHNARSVVADLRTVGHAVWDRFTASREESLWSYRALVDAFRANPAHRPALIDELDRTVTEMERLAAATCSASEHTDRDSMNQGPNRGGSARMPGIQPG